MFPYGRISVGLSPSFRWNPTECFTSHYKFLCACAQQFSLSHVTPHPSDSPAASQDVIMTNLRRSLDVVDVDTANRAEVLDDLAKSLESVKVSVTLILGHAISALECRVPPDALVSKTLATRGPGAGILELSLFDHNLGHVPIPDGLSYKDFGFSISEGVDGPCRLPVDLQARAILARAFTNIATFALARTQPSPSDTQSLYGMTNPDPSTMDDPSERLTKVQILTRRLTETVETPGPSVGFGVMIPSLLGDEVDPGNTTLPTMSRADLAHPQPGPVALPELPPPPGGQIAFPGGEIGLNNLPPIFVSLSRNPNSGDLMSEATDTLLAMDGDAPYPFLSFARTYVNVSTPRETIDSQAFATDVALALADETAAYLSRVTEREEAIASYHTQMMEYHSKCVRVTADRDTLHADAHAASYTAVSDFHDQCQAIVTECSKRVVSLKERSHTNVSAQKGDEMIRRTKAMSLIVSACTRWNRNTRKYFSLAEKPVWLSPDTKPPLGLAALGPENLYAILDIVEGLETVEKITEILFPADHNSRGRMTSVIPKLMLGYAPGSYEIAIGLTPFPVIELYALLSTLKSENLTEEVFRARIMAVVTPVMNGTPDLATSASKILDIRNRAISFGLDSHPGALMKAILDGPLFLIDTWKNSGQFLDAVNKATEIVDAGNGQASPADLAALWTAITDEIDRQTRSGHRKSSTGTLANVHGLTPTVAPPPPAPAAVQQPAAPAAPERMVTCSARICLRHLSLNGCPLMEPTGTSIPWAANPRQCMNLYHPKTYADAPPREVEKIALTLGRLPKGFPLNSTLVLSFGIGYNSLSEQMRHFNPNHPSYPAGQPKVSPPGTIGAPYYANTGLEGDRPSRRGSRRSRDPRATPPAAPPAYGTPPAAVLVPMAAAMPTPVQSVSSLETYELLVRQSPDLGDPIADAVMKTYTDPQQQSEALCRVYDAYQISKRA